MRMTVYRKRGPYAANRIENVHTAPEVSRPRVVIVGGGFGGLSAAKTLRRAAVDVTVIDRTNHYLFQPLLYQVATGVLSAADIAVPTRFLLRTQRNARVLLATVSHVDVDGRVVIAEDRQIPYDYLIIATGARHAYFGRPEWERVAPGLKSLADAHEIRTRFLLAFEEAEKTSDPAEQKALLTFVIVGAGPTGVELAGMIPTIARKGIRREFRKVDPAWARVVLLEAGPRVLPTFPQVLSDRATRDLQALGVEVRTNTLVTRVTPDSVQAGDECIPTRTVLWAAGNAASPLVSSLGTALDRTGRALVEADLSVSGHPEVFVIGDAAAAPLLDRQHSPGASPRFVPAVAAAANQMGRHAAKMIILTVAGQPRRPFRYKDRGALAVIGRGRAIAALGRLRLAGHFAFVTWLFVHLAYLAGFRNRVSVMLEWAYAYFTYRPGARVLGEEDRLRPAAARVIADHKRAS